MKMEKIGFLEAVRSLAERVNIHLTTDPGDDARNREIELLYGANQTAAEFYSGCLWKTPEGKPALQYILKRGFQQKTLVTFKIGYAPNQWDGLINKAGQSGIKPDVLLQGIDRSRRTVKGITTGFAAG
jgi:DNA primase